MTVLDVIQRSTDFLAKKSVDSPRLQAELLLAHILRLPRMQLYLNFERVLSADQEDLLRKYVKRRGEREPLQHIIGSTCFCGLEMQVNRQVLIPRPETELLAEQGWLFLNTLAKARDTDASATSPSALDFGTGSGCLAITLAVQCPVAQVMALDISPDALQIARGNAQRHGVSERIDFRLGDGLASLPEARKFDLIVANPPYIPTSEIDSLQPEVRDYDPRTALDGGLDGLDYYRHLAGQAHRRLKPSAKIMMEIGHGQEEQVALLFQTENWVVESILKDYTHRPRMMIAHTTRGAAGPDETHG